MDEYLKQIDNFEQVSYEIQTLKKYGIDYRLERGHTSQIINRINPPKLNLVVCEIIDETSDAKTLRLISKDGYLPPFEAGQYINVFVEIDGVFTSRPYSISSSPKQRAYYEITVAHIAKGFVSDYLLNKVKVGDELVSSAPSGQFHYNPVFHGKNLVFLAGGSGITPFMSMIREVLNAGFDRNIHLLYGSRTEEAAIFLDELKNLASRHSNFKFNLVLSEPNSSYNGYTGFINAKCIENEVKNINSTTFYICGPEAMYDYCFAELDKLKVPFRKIRREMFASRQDIQSELGWPENLTGNEVFNVKIAGNKTIKACSHESLLTALERAGIRVNVCCRSGECSLCRVKLVSGKVFQARGVLLRYADEKYGYIHSCKSYPMEDLEIML